MQYGNRKKTIENGVWILNVEDPGGEYHEISGALTENITESINIEHFLQQKLQIDNLWLFGNNAENMEPYIKNDMLTFDDFPKG